MAATDRETRMAREPIRPERVRAIDSGGFAFVPNRFLREGFFASLTPDELRLYLLLVLAGDRRGMSYYHYDSICSILEIGLDEYIAARNGLIDKDLVAYDGTRFQVLSLPRAPRPRLAVEPADAAHDDAGNEIRRALLESLRRPD
jgi:hypothetical protein